MDKNERKLDRLYLKFDIYFKKYLWAKRNGKHIRAFVYNILHRYYNERHATFWFKTPKKK